MKKQFHAAYTIKIAMLMVVIAIAGSCGSKQEIPQEQITEVDFLTLQTGAASLEKKYPGTIEGSANVDIKAQVSGYLEQIYIKEGDYVNKGQPLFKIKGDVFQEQVNNSQASLKAALAAQATAKIEVEKVRPLVEGKVVSPLQLETAEAQYQSASAQVSQAKAALSSSRINANFATVKAPVSGYIGRIPNRIGNLVTPGDAVPLTSLSDITQVFVYFSMSEADFISYARDKKSGAASDKVEMVMADGKVYEHPGRLEIASGNIDPATGTMALKAIFPNPDRLLRSGGSARVILSKTLASALRIPMSGVKDIQNKRFVFVLADSNKVEMRPIEINGHDRNDYIVESGLKAGERIALNSIDNLNHGMKVAPTSARANPSKTDNTQK